MGLSKGTVRGGVRGVHYVCRHKAFTASEQKHFVLCEQVYFGEYKLQFLEAWPKYCFFGLKSCILGT